MSSGVAVDDACVAKFTDMKMKHLLRYIIFEIEDKKKIVVKHEGDKDATYDDFEKCMKENYDGEVKKGCYALVDVHFEKDDGTPQDKIVFITFASDECNVKEKMLVASSQKALLKKFPAGISKEVQASDTDGYSFKEVLSKLK